MGRAGAYWDTRTTLYPQFQRATLNLIESATALKVDNPCPGVHQQRDNQAVQSYDTIQAALAAIRSSEKHMSEQHTQDLSKNQNKDHAHVKSRLLRAYLPSSQSAKPNRQSGAQLKQTSVQSHLLREVVGNQHRNNEAVYA
ncbi:hypothetical protein RIB2604_00900760 [Aspergillus luchuensis]|uniref:Uncharacterized protein n=1 Tax=Aspergillus kawachii TaxID=1069201 RepID=A0A146F4M0_ASPKA|nr:hypothetical protein RIB2604_00900760 [Aspergillus luchuensis]